MSKQDWIYNRLLPKFSKDSKFILIQTDLPKERRYTMKAIITKYLPATNHKPSRIKAYDCDKNSITLSYDYEFDGELNYKRVAVALCKKMGWDQELLGGGVNNGYVFVFKNQ